MPRQRPSDPVRRLLASLVLGAPLPLAFLGGGLLQPQGVCGSVELQLCTASREVTAFAFVAPALLFAMLVFAFWTLMRRRRFA